MDNHSLISIDTISSRGPIQQAPMFLVRALRQIIYRLQQTMLWSSNNDIRLYIAKQHYIDFMVAWLETFPSVEPVRKMVEDEIIEIDGIKISIKQAFGDSINLGVFRVDNNELIKWDESSSRMLFRVPWSMAKFEIESFPTFLEPTGPKDNYEYLP